ncbi:MAG: metal ABC transporter ATP-binding protein [Treponema sp.]|nr:metal ABC transporter ATP-binding protein [Treponema sp.]
MNLASSQIAIQFDSVSFAYGDTPILENASFHIHRGEFAALVGPNGSGKTTVLKLILGLEQPASGQITLFGDARAGAKRDRLGYVGQQFPADTSFPVSVRDVIRMGLLRPSQRYGAKARLTADEAMEQAGISGIAAMRWGALSGGQKRRVLVARALAAQPELLILDEPAANMDAQSEQRLFETLGKLKGNATVLIVTHDMDYVSALTDRVFCMGDSHQHRGIVQHKTEAAAEDSGHRGEAGLQRVLHGENIPGDKCC